MCKWQRNVPSRVLGRCAWNVSRRIKNYNHQQSSLSLSWPLLLFAIHFCSFCTQPNVCQCYRLQSQCIWCVRTYSHITESVFSRQFDLSRYKWIRLTTFNESNTLSIEINHIFKLTRNRKKCRIVMSAIKHARTHTHATVSCHIGGGTSFLIAPQNEQQKQRTNESIERQHEAANDSSCGDTIHR